MIRALDNDSPDFEKKSSLRVIPFGTLCGNGTLSRLEIAMVMVFSIKSFMSKRG